MRNTPYLFTFLFALACAPGPVTVGDATESTASETQAPDADLPTPEDMPSTGDGDGDGDGFPGDGDGEAENRGWGQILCLADDEHYPYCFAQGVKGLALAMRPKWVGSPEWSTLYDFVDAPLACVTELEPNAFGLECYRLAGLPGAPVECFARSTDPTLPVGLYFPIACTADATWTVDPAPLSNSCDKTPEAARVQGFPTLCSDNRPTCRESLHGAWVHTVPACTLADLDVVAVTDFAL